MATRMQQRRGTAAQWLAADPILAAGEIGFESDTGEFRIGDGVNHWDQLSPFKNLEDLGGNLDDFILLTSINANDGVAGLDETGQIFESQLVDYTAKTQDIHGIDDTALLIDTGGLEAAIVQALSDAAVDATTQANTAQSNAETSASGYVSTHNSDTTNVHGIADTADLATLNDVAAVTASTLGLGNVDNTSDANKPVSTATETAIGVAKSEALAEVAAVIDGAPGALNTLNELAAALGDDANFASTVTNELATKVDSFTPITQKTASYTLSTLDHRDDLIEMGSVTALTLTIPLNSTIAYPVGTSLDILQTNTGQVTIAGADGVSVNATPGLKLRTQWSSATLFKRAENAWVVYGDLTA